MAARDRYGGFAEPAITPLQRFIQNACDPQNYEPNLALDLEIADLINSKKGNAPREAAVTIVSHVNNRNPNISLLALTLLDICVKNCGYPFHLQISTKEFLNELVRRFPERPPIRYSRTQNKILELIEEWRQTICQNSKYKDDLGFVRDMHRLLSYKGYGFPEVKREDAAVLNPSDNLRSAEEMEEEERAAQSAKLQELIRRGTPRDLQEANRLMKIMAGYDQRHKTDYRAKAAEEVSKIQQKARLLEEMLQTNNTGGETGNETSEELANSLASAQPKIQKMCEEESDDHEAVAKLFEINDSIHRTLERHKLVKKGDLEGASKIPRGTLGMSGAGVSKGPDNELSLIDLGGPEEAQSNSNNQWALQQGGSTSVAAQSSSGGGGLENDLLGLSMDDSNPGQISLGSGPMQSPPPPPGFTPASQQASVSSPSPPSAPPRPAQSNLDIFSSLGGVTSSAAPTVGLPPSTTTASGTQRQVPPQQRAVDPFASLSSPQPPRTSSPFQYQQGGSPAPHANRPLPSAPQSNASTTLSQLMSPPPIPSPNVPQQQRNGPTNQAAPTTSGDDEWNFTSALPEQKHEIVILQSAVSITLTVSRPPAAPSEILIQSHIVNNTPTAISDLTFQAAVTKSFHLAMEPQTSRHLAPHTRNGIQQVMHLRGVQPGQAHTVKVRWKVSYLTGEQRKEEQGEIAGLGVADN
ncbi:MAG: hypothetical protein M1828_003863 [Chrysothrix sp. TS-e1954]|nr:MAG: hypothetical protein M1828_003863 [Chrysothrix sp. TS-e1954]